MREDLIVKHCAPTLAGLKTGNLFSCYCSNLKKLQNQISYWNSMLNKKGVKISLLRYSEYKALIYIYRPKKLASDISKDEATDLLMCNGYSSCDTEYCVKQLSKRLACSKNFPHEIGLFLGYPLKDVKAFIKNQGKHSKCTGCWKVYFNECEALKTFAKFKKCTNIYIKLLSEGRSVPRLTITA